MKPIVNCHGWAIIDTREGWCTPSYVRMSISGCWEAFQANYGQGSVSVGELEELGYRAIEVLICPIRHLT